MRLLKITKPEYQNLFEEKILKEKIATSEKDTNKNNNNNNNKNII